MKHGSSYKNVKTMRQYITQYGFWWSSSKDKFEQFLKSGANGEFEEKGFNLNDWFKPLKSVPNHLGVYHKPLDWDQKDFIDELKHLTG